MSNVTVYTVTRSGLAAWWKDNVIVVYENDLYKVNIVNGVHYEVNRKAHGYTYFIKASCLPQHIINKIINGKCTAFDLEQFIPTGDWNL